MKPLSLVSTIRGVNPVAFIPVFCVMPHIKKPICKDIGLLHLLSYTRSSVTCTRFEDQFLCDTWNSSALDLKRVNLSPIVNSLIPVLFISLASSWNISEVGAYLRPSLFPFSLLRFVAEVSALFPLCAGL